MTLDDRRPSNETVFKDHQDMPHVIAHCNTYPTEEELVAQNFFSHAGHKFDVPASARGWKIAGKEFLVRQNDLIKAARRCNRRDKCDETGAFITTPFCLMMSPPPPKFEAGDVIGLMSDARDCPWRIYLYASSVDPAANEAMLFKPIRVLNSEPGTEANKRRAAEDGKTVLKVSMLSTEIDLVEVDKNMPFSIPHSVLRAPGCKVQNGVIISKLWRQDPDAKSIVYLHKKQTRKPKKRGIDFI